MSPAQPPTPPPPQPPYPPPTPITAAPQPAHLPPHPAQPHPSVCFTVHLRRAKHTPQPAGNPKTEDVFLLAAVTEIQILI